MYNVFSKAPLIEDLPFTIRSLLLNGNCLYIGTLDGLLLVYHIEDLKSANPKAEFVESKQIFLGRPIDQLAIIKELSTLVTLSDNTVTIHDLHTLTLQTKLLPTSGATEFTFMTTIEKHGAEGTPSSGIGHLSVAAELATVHSDSTIPVLVTRLCAAVRRRLVVFTWMDTIFESVKEIPMPERIQSVTWINSYTLCVGFESYCSLVSLRKYISAHQNGSQSQMRLSQGTALGFTVASKYRDSGGSKPRPNGVRQDEWMRTVYRYQGSRTDRVPRPVRNETPSNGGPFQPQTVPEGGWFRWGRRPRLKRNKIIRVSEKDVLWVRYECSLVLDTQRGSQNRNPKGHIQWSGALGDAMYFSPYIVGVVDNRYLEVRNVMGGSMQQRRGSTSSQSGFDEVVQIIEIPDAQFIASTTSMSQSIMAEEDPAMLGSKATQPSPVIIVATTSSVWQLRPTSFTDQLNLLISAKHYDDAIGFLDAISVDDKVKEYRRIMTLRAKHLFECGKWEESLSIFQQLFTPVDYILELFEEQTESCLSNAVKKVNGGHPNVAGHTSESDSSHQNPCRHGSPAMALKQPPGSPNSSPLSRNGDRVSLTNPNEFPEELPVRIDADETLIRFLTERRLMLGSRRQTVEKKLSDPQLPSPSLTSLQSDLRFMYQESERVDTALLQVYLKTGSHMRKSAGALLRLHPCFVKFEDSERMLEDLGYYEELLDLYFNKKMHRKALDLLSNASQDVSHELCGMTFMIQYLTRLREDESEWSLVKDFASFVFSHGSYSDGITIFLGLSDPRVLEYLKSVSRSLAQTYLERQVLEYDDDRPEFHHLLAKTWAQKVKEMQYKHLSEENSPPVDHDVSSKLLALLQKSKHYDTRRLLASIGERTGDGLDAHRAVLYSRIGQHDKALEVYVEKLADDNQAESYCGKHYPDSPEVYLILFKLFVKNNKDPLPLLDKYGTKLAAYEAVDLLPDGTGLAALASFLPKVVARLRRSRHASQIQKNLMKASHVQIRQKMAYFQSRRITLDEYSVCPVCAKRIGSSVFAWLPQSDQVVHYGCSLGSSKRPLM